MNPSHEVHVRQRGAQEYFSSSLLNRYPWCSVGFSCKAAVFVICLGPSCTHASASRESLLVTKPWEARCVLKSAARALPGCALMHKLPLNRRLTSNTLTHISGSESHLNVNASKMKPG